MKEWPKPDKDGGSTISRWPEGKLPDSGDETLKNGGFGTQKAGGVIGRWPFPKGSLMVVSS